MSSSPYLSWYDGDKTWWMNLKIIVITSIIFNLVAYGLTYKFCLKKKIKNGSKVYKKVSMQDLDVVTE